MKSKFVGIIFAGVILFTACSISRKEYSSLKRESVSIKDIDNQINILDGRVLLKNTEVISAITNSAYKTRIIGDSGSYYTYFKKFTFSGSPNQKQLLTIYSLSCDTCNFTPTIAENEIIVFEENGKRIGAYKASTSRIAPRTELDRLSFHIITKWQFEMPSSGKVSIAVFTNNMNFEKKESPYIHFDKSYKRILQSVYGNFMISIQDLP